MIILLLILILAVLLFGSAAIIGLFGIVLGAVALTGAAAYAFIFLGVEITFENLILAFVGLLVLIFVVERWGALSPSAQRRRTKQAENDKYFAELRARKESERKG